MTATHDDRAELLACCDDADTLYERTRDPRYLMVEVDKDELRALLGERAAHTATKAANAKLREVMEAAQRVIDGEFGMVVTTGGKPPELTAGELEDESRWDGLHTGRYVLLGPLRAALAAFSGEFGESSE